MEIDQKLTRLSSRLRTGKTLKIRIKDVLVKMGAIVNRYKDLEFLSASQVSCEKHRGSSWSRIQAFTAD